VAQDTGPRRAAPPAVAWLVGSFLGATVALLLAGVGILLGVEQGRPYDSWSILLVNAPVFATVGAVLAARRPDHPIGLDLDTLSSELLGVVDRTVQPAGVSLGLRPGSGRP
jgi:hypothetical protein